VIFRLGNGSARRFENFGLFYAARQVVLNHDVEPYRPEGWESDMDIRGESLDDLEYWWKKGA